jgi:tryptophanyl-tRNA synthetase
VDGLATETNRASKRVVSGMRPTGKLHIGHYFGALENWVRLQNDPDYECFYFIADWHALTSDYADTSAVAQNTIEIATDYLAAGLDPEKSVIFQQSLVPEHAELHLLLSMVTPLGWLERVPTYKEALENITNKDLHTYGFLGYPCLQTADIVIYSEQGMLLFVPVGEDQVSHVEVSREIVKKFNFHNIVLDSERLMRSDPQTAMCFEIIRDSFSGGLPFSGAVRFGHSEGEIDKLQTLVRNRVAEIGLKNWMDHLARSFEERLGSDEHWRQQVEDFSSFKESHAVFRAFHQEILVEPQAMLTPTPRIPGLDGRKMSKSYGNAITLSETDADIRSKTKVMVTDPARRRRTDPGNPDVCPVYDWHKLFSPAETLEWAATGCRTAGIGCIECKAAMADNLIKWIAPVRERRVRWEQDPKGVLEIIDAGSKKARAVAQGTMGRVREAVFGWQRKRAELAGQ